jgi:hypothetical protein
MIAFAIGKLFGQFSYGRGDWKGIQEEWRNS